MLVSVSKNKMSAPAPAKQVFTCDPKNPVNPNFDCTQKVGPGSKCQSLISGDKWVYQCTKLASHHQRSAGRRFLQTPEEEAPTAMPILSGVSTPTEAPTEMPILSGVGTPTEMPILSGVGTDGGLVRRIVDVVQDGNGSCCDHICCHGISILPPRIELNCVSNPAPK